MGKPNQVKIPSCMLSNYLKSPHVFIIPNCKMNIKLFQYGDKLIPDGFICDVKSNFRIDVRPVFSNSFSGVKGNVLRIISGDDLARKCYAWLCLRYWMRMNGVNVVVKKGDVENFTSPETICRAFRSLMEDARDGLGNSFLLDEKGEQMREEKEETMKEYFKEKKKNVI